MFKPTFEGEHQNRVCWYVVFDSRDGRVVHIHKFISEADVEDEITVSQSQEHMALEAAKRHCDSPNLRIMQVPVHFCIEQGAMYQVDLGSGELTKKANLSIREFAERARLRKTAKADS